MGLLDKLKPQPRWKHADPAIRLEGVRELDDAPELASLAETDPDVRVRRAALAKIEDPEALGRIAASDPDADIRDRAAERLVAIACRVTGTEPVADLEIARRAVRGLADPRRLSMIAKSDAADVIRADALAAVSDPRALGGIARQARQESTAAAALARLADSAVDELLDVALNAGHRDVAAAAFERLTTGTLDPDALRSVELRAQHKVVSRRARTLLHELEAAEAARQAAVLERQRREHQLIDSASAVAGIVDPAAMRTELARVRAAWEALAVVEPAAIERFDAAVAAAMAAIDRREREAEEELERRRARAEALATRLALCERVETLDGEDVLAQLVPLEEEWRSLLPVADNGPEADRLADRFARAVAACRTRHEMGAKLEATRASLDALVTEAEALPASDDTAQAAERWQSLQGEARGLMASLAAASRPAADLVDRLDAVGRVFAARHAETEAKAAEAVEAQATLLRRLVERTRRAAEADSLTLREGERLMRDLGAALDEVDKAAAAPEVKRLGSELRTWQEKVAPRVRELRDMDEWRKFANAQRQEQLISLAEAIVAALKADEEAGKTSDLPATAKALREFHAEWQKVAEAPRQSAQRLWDRFRTATDFIRARCEPFFAKRREEREAARGRRLAIVEEAEVLAQSNEWSATAARLQALQGEWQALGHPTTDSERELTQRFRTACNAFFVRRREDLTDRKKLWADNLAKKDALCERAEQLAESTDWDAAATEMKRLQAEWKTIGPVRKNRSEVVWTRFRSAADKFFERYHHRHEIALAGKLAEREAWVVELEALASLPVEDTPADAAETVQRLRTTWNRAVPVPVPGMKDLADRWQAAFASLLSTRPQLFAGTDLDPKTIVARMEKLVLRVEGLLTESRATPEARLSPTELLAARLRNALASNAMGGRAHEDTRQRSAADSAKDALGAWQRLPPVTTPEAEALTRRFRDACRKLGVGDVGRRPAGHGSREKQGPRSAQPETEDESRREVATV